MQTALLLAYIMATDNSESTLALGQRLATQIAIILVYLAPTIVAQRYRHPKQPAILMLNIVLGWTIVGWVVALIWALNGRRQE